MAEQHKPLSIDWQLYAAIGAVLVNVGVNLAMLNGVRADLTDLKAAAPAAHDKIVETQVRLLTVETRVGATETMQRSDHDSLMRMATQVEHVAAWVDRQEQTAGSRP